VPITINIVDLTVSHCDDLHSKKPRKTPQLKPDRWFSNHAYENNIVQHGGSPQIPKSLEPSKLKLDHPDRDQKKFLGESNRPRTDRSLGKLNSTVGFKTARDHYGGTTNDYFTAKDLGSIKKNQTAINFSEALSKNQKLDNSYHLSEKMTPKSPRDFQGNSTGLGLRVADRLRETFFFRSKMVKLIEFLSKTLNKVCSCKSVIERLKSIKNSFRDLISTTECSTSQPKYKSWILELLTMFESIGSVLDHFVDEQLKCKKMLLKAESTLLATKKHLNMPSRPYPKEPCGDYTDQMLLLINEQQNLWRLEKQQLKSLNDTLTTEVQKNNSSTIKSQMQNKIATMQSEFTTIGDELGKGIERRDGLIIKFDIERNGLLEKILELTRINLELDGKYRAELKDQQVLRKTTERLGEKLFDLENGNLTQASQLDFLKYELKVERAMKDDYNGQLRVAKEQLNKIFEAQMTYSTLIGNFFFWARKFRTGK
jgi:hypothetical protein